MIQLHQPGANMSIVDVGESRLFFSYGTLVAAQIEGLRMRGPARSKTTAAHLTKMNAKGWAEHGATEREFATIVEAALSGNPPA